MSGKNESSKQDNKFKDGKRRLRSTLWFDNPDNPGMTALYIERYLNFGLTPGELRSLLRRHRISLREISEQST